MGATEKGKMFQQSSAAAGLRCTVVVVLSEPSRSSSCGFDDFPRQAGIRPPCACAVPNNRLNFIVRAIVV